MFPQEDSPQRADVVVVLAGSPGDRLPEGLALVRRGVAPVLYVSDGAREEKRGFCHRARPFPVVPKNAATLTRGLPAGSARSFGEFTRKRASRESSYMESSTI